METIKGYMPVLGLLAALGSLGCGASGEDQDRLDLLEEDRVLEVAFENGDLLEETSFSGSTAFSESSVLRTYAVESDHRIAFAGEVLHAAASAGWSIGPPVDETCENDVLYIGADKDFGPWKASLILIVNLEDGGDEVTVELTAPNAERHPGDPTEYEFPPTDVPEVPCSG